jgi:hypothetical protein
MVRSDWVTQIVIEERHDRFRREAEQQSLVELVREPRVPLLEAIRRQLGKLLIQIRVQSQAESLPCATASNNAR